MPHRRLLLDRSHRHQDQGEKKKGTSEKRGKRGDGDGDGKDGEENNYYYQDVFVALQIGATLIHFVIMDYNSIL